MYRSNSLRQISTISKFKFEPKPETRSKPLFQSGKRVFEDCSNVQKTKDMKKLKTKQDFEWITWSAFGYEILNSIDVKEYHIEGYNLVLRHNESNMFVEKIEKNSNLKQLLKKLEVVGKTYGNNHISGFCCVADRARIIPADENIGDFYKVGVTIRSFVENNLKRILKDMALFLLKYCDDDVSIGKISQSPISHSPISQSPILQSSIPQSPILQSPIPQSPIMIPEDGMDMNDVPMVIDVDTSMNAMNAMNAMNSMNPMNGMNITNKDNWALLIHSIPGKYMDLDTDWMKFLRMCLDVANTLGVSNREHMYQNCLKAMMTTKHISHMCPYQCVVKLPTGDMVMIGECDILIEFGTNRHYLVELKVCSQWRRYESQVKKYINACHSIGKKIAGAAIVNFNPKGVVEVIMFETNVRHSVCM